jgi:hypothetical protein
MPVGSAGQDDVIAALPLALEMPPTVISAGDLDFSAMRVRFATGRRATAGS